MCDHCNYKAKAKLELKRHIEATHIGIRYSCDQCKYEARHNSHLKRHIMSIHDKIRYPCNQSD